MTANRAANLFHRIRADHVESDADLLQRFAEARDATAFAALVQRHGPLVLGVCRRTLGHAHDAEDAFQAVFLVLAQKAGQLRDAQLLSSWLYGVAWRVAKKARRRAARRREEPRANVPEPLTADVAMNDVGPVLDEELAALPAWYRDAVLACDVEQLSRAEAAAKLGIPEGTLSSRLAAGRKRLAERLARRGVTLALPLLATMATAGVSEALIQQTVETVAQWAAGGAVAKPVAELTHEGLTMLRKLLLLGTGILAASAVGVGLADGPAKPDGAKPPAAKPTAVEVAKPEAKFGPPRPRAIVNVMSGVSAIHWSADGQRIAVSGGGPGPAQQFGAMRSAFETFKFADGDLQPLIRPTNGVVGEVLGFHPTDEGSVLLHVAETGGINVRNSFVASSGKAKAVDLADDSLTFLSMAADGRAVLMTSYDEAEKTTAVHEIDFTTGKSKRVVIRTADDPMVVTPDGGTAVTATRVARKTKTDLGNGTTREEDVWFLTGLAVVDCKTGQKRFTWKMPRADVQSADVALSRDGKVVAFGAGDAAHVLDAGTDRELRTYPAAEKRVTSELLLSHDGRLTVVREVNVAPPPAGAGSGPPLSPPQPWRSPTFVTVYDNATGKAIKKWETNLALTMAFAPDRPALAILECPSSGNGGGPPPGMSMGPPGGMAAAAGQSGRLGIWEFAVEKK